MTATLLALALTASPAIPIPDIPFRKYVLPNGLTLVVHEDHKAPIVSVNVWYHVGSKDERPGRTGFAHLFEHLMFEGSEHHRAEWTRTVDGMGATDVNGTTDQDRTNYFQTVPVSALDAVLWLESDRMGHLVAAITQEKLDQERGVVQNEKRQGENQPYGRVEDAMTPAIYPRGHPYSWPVIGSMEDLNAASLDDVVGWFRTWYGAANATLVVAGDVSAEDVKARVERFFGDVPGGPPITRQKTWVAKRSGTQRQEMEDRVPQARVYLVWNTAEWGAEDDDLLDLAARVLASGKTSRLYKRLVYDDQIATDVAAAQGSSELGSNFEISATARPGGDLAAVERAVREELTRFLARGPTPEEVERVRAERLAAFVRASERVGGYAGGGLFGKSDILARSQVFGGRPDFYRTRLERVREARPGSIAGAARRWLSDGAYVLSVRPYPALPGGAGPDRSRVPEPGPAPEPRFPDFTRTVLPGGLRVLVAERRAVPLVTFQLLVDAGYSSDPPGAPGTARLAAAMLAEGTVGRTSLQISEQLARLGARLDTGANLDQTVVSLSALRVNLDASLAILADVVLRPTFPQADFDRLQKQVLAGIEREQSQPTTLALRVLPRLLYPPGHAYASPFTGSGTRASVAALRREDVVRWAGRWMRPNAATLVVAGDTSAAEIVPKLEKLFAGWKPAEVPRKNLADAPLPERSRIYLVDRPGSIQSMILVGQPAPPRANPRELAQATLNTVLGGQYASRVNANLRESKHWSYGAGTVLADARGPRPFFGYAAVQADKTVESLAEFRKELGDIRGPRPVTADELALARSRRSLTLPGRWEGQAAVAASLAELVRFGFPDDYWATYAARARAVTLADVAEAARFLEPDRLVWVVVGDRSKVEEALRGLGLGDPVLLDLEGNPAR